MTVNIKNQHFKAVALAFTYSYGWFLFISLITWHIMQDAGASNFISVIVIWISGIIFAILWGVPIFIFMSEKLIGFTSMEGYLAGVLPAPIITFMIGPSYFMLGGGSGIYKTFISNLYSIISLFGVIPEPWQGGAGEANTSVFFLMFVFSFMGLCWTLHKKADKHN